MGFAIVEAIMALNKAKDYSDSLQASELAYVYIKYSTIQPDSNDDMTDTPSAWMGVYSGSSATEPTNYTDYEWFNIKGSTPVKGTDYWTAGEVIAMATDVDNSVQDTLTDFTDVAGSGTGLDTYACDVASKKVAKFAITIADTDAKIVTFSNVPTGRCEVELEITTSAVASVTWALNSGSSLAWLGGFAPTLESGKVYLVGFRTKDSGVTWDGYPTAGV